MTGLPYGQICGVVYVDRHDRSVRCYGRARERFGGRCADHEHLGQERGKRLGSLRCGYTGTTGNGLPCAYAVYREGQRCAVHTPSRLQDKLARKIEQRDALEREIAALRLALAGSQPQSTEDCA